MNKIAQNILQVKTKIEQAAERVRRETAKIKLIAVTKTVEVEKIREAIAAGITVFGENRVQEARKKIAYLAPSYPFLEWHMIGHLQTNKVKYLFNLFELVHSVDNLKLAEEINKRGELIKRRINILVQVNISREATKFGIERENLEDLLRKITNLKNISLKGLMTIPPFSPDPEDSRPVYALLNRLKKELNSRIDNLHLEELSMGMSNDFEVAVEEGATMLRIGSAIFGARD